VIVVVELGMMIIVGGMPVYCSLLPLLLLFNTIDCRGKDHPVYPCEYAASFIVTSKICKVGVSKYVDEILPTKMIKYSAFRRTLHGRHGLTIINL
jgi:hypothetical protein